MSSAIIVAPPAAGEESYDFSRWQQSENEVSFATCTWGNPTTTTAAVQGVCLTLSGGPKTVLRGRFNGKKQKGVKRR